MAEFIFYESNPAWSNPLDFDMTQKPHLVLPLKVKVGESNPDITGGGKEKRFQLNLLPPPSRLPPSTLQAHDQSAPTAHPICKTSPKSKTTHHQVPITHHPSPITYHPSPMSGRWVSKWWVLSKNIFLWVCEVRMLSYSSIQFSFLSLLARSEQ